MERRRGRGRAELEAWDRELRGDREPEAGGEDSPVGPEVGARKPDGHPGAAPDPGATTAPAEGAPPEKPAANAPRSPRGQGATTEPGELSAPPAEGLDRPALREELAESEEEGVTTEVLVRDLIIFQIKLLLDGLKDVILSPLSIAAVVWDLIPSRKGPRGRTFYQVLRIGERFDLWLNLYNPDRQAGSDNEGLLESARSADSLVGKLERMAREEAQRHSERSGKKTGHLPEG